MKKIFLMLFVTLLISNSSYSMLWEIGLRVLDNHYPYSPYSAHVYLYKFHNFYYELYREGWTNTNDDVNGTMDVLYCSGTANTTDSIWAPVEPGTYYLRIDNFYCYFTFDNPECGVPGYGPPDVRIKYSYGQFTLLNVTWAVSEIHGTYNWNEIKSNFKQLKSDGVTPLGTVAIGQGSGFSPRYTAPYDFYINKNQTYLFHADTNIISSQKYFQYQNISDVTNFSTQNVGTQNYNVTAMFNPAYTPITIKNYFLESSSTNAGNIYFKDPWLIDYKDPNYGNNRRNRGMDGAVFTSRSSPFYPDTRYYGGESYRGIFLNQGGPPLWVSPYYSIQAPQSVDFGGTLGIRNVYLQNWSADPSNNASFEDANSSETGVVFNSSNSTTIKANLKILHLSNDASAFSNNSQRKLIETKSGSYTFLHQVYTSMGHVWIEHSSDAGISWILGNNGQPLDGTAGGKNPSIAYTTNTVNNDYNYIGVVWQQPYSSHYKICGKMFNQALSSSQVPQPYNAADYTIFTEPSDAYSVNANPNLVLTGGASGPFFITIERKSAGGDWGPGITWLVGHITNSGGWQFGTIESSGNISGTNASSINIQMSPYPGYENSLNVSVNLLRQQGSPGTIYSHYIYLNHSNGYWEYHQQNDGMISYNSNINFNPSIVSLANGYYAASWVEYSDMTFYFFGHTRYYFGTSGYNTQSCSINRGGGSSSSGFAAWSQYGSSWLNRSIRFDNGIPVTSSIQTLSTSGKYVQVGNGAGTDLSNMRVSSFYPFSSPYYFNTSGALTPLNKTTTDFVTGRGFEINLGMSAFRYEFNDLNVDGKNISFVEAPDELDYGKVETLNNALITEPLQVNENLPTGQAGSKIVFSEKAGFSDSTEAAKKLGKDGFVNYMLELIDDATGKVLAPIRSENINSANAHSIRTPSYSLNAKGIAGKTVRIKISLETNLIEKSSPGLVVGDSANIPENIKARLNIQRSNLMLVKRFNEGNETLTKTVFSNLDVMDLGVPTTYALAQNYPNPFNPTTTINYQIPKDGFVTLKIFDVLGKEVATLVNENKSTGRYSVKFSANGESASGGNAGNLASGVYLYQLKINDFVSTKKLVLLK